LHFFILAYENNLQEWYPQRLGDFLDRAGVCTTWI